MASFFFATITGSIMETYRKGGERMTIIGIVCIVVGILLIVKDSK